MKENIETKDVQRTEYLDKNGLDMLWTKVKENTHNQVEVEYNRAKAKEDSLSQEIASVKPAEGKEFLQVEEIYNTKTLKDGPLAFGNIGNQAGVTKYAVAQQEGFLVYSAKDEQFDFKTVNISSTGIQSEDERKSDTKVWNTNGGITDLTSYALNSDVTEKFATKADATALSNYVLTTALNKQVDTLNAAISAKQDAGNYIPYNAMVEGSYQIDKVLDILTDNGTAKFGPQTYIAIQSNNGAILRVQPTYLYGKNGDTAIDINASGISLTDDDSVIRLSSNGVTLPYGDNNSVLTSNGSTINIGEYVTQDNLNGQLAPKANRSDLTALEEKVTAATKEKLGVVKVGDGLNVTDGTVSVDPEYIIDMLSYGVEWDTTISDPACTRIGNPLYHKQLPIQSQYKGCLVKNGKVNYYLDPNDWSKKADGTPSVLDGTDGDVMVHIPKFYGKSGSNGNKRWVRIATTKIDPSWVEIPEMFVSAYNVTVNEGSAAPKAASVVNTSSSYRGGDNREGYDQYLSTDKFRTDLGKPRTNVSRATMRTYANNSGQELLCYEFYKWVFYWAYVIEYANFNSQKEFNSELTSDGYHQGGLGPGVVFQRDFLANYNGYSPITPCGYTNEFGNFSGTKEISIPQFQVGSTTEEGETCYSNRWRGFENPFGDTHINLDGIVLKRDSAYAESKVYTTTDSSKFNGGSSVMNVAGIEVAANGYIKEFDLGETGEIIPQLIGGSGSTYKCDYHYCNSSSTNNRTLFVGGGNLGGNSCGLGFFSSDYTVGEARPDAGFRSVIRA